MIYNRFVFYLGFKVSDGICRLFLNVKECNGKSIFVYDEWFSLYLFLKVLGDKFFKI